MPVIRDEVLRRLVVSKQLLLNKGGQLTPSSDAVAVAHMILTAHDSAELVAAAIAQHVGVTSLTDKTYLMDYPALIEKVCSKSGPFPGKDFLKQLNTVRIYFKHNGILPDPRDWYRVIENTWEWVNQWCSTYVGISFDEIDLEQLLANPSPSYSYRQRSTESPLGEIMSSKTQAYSIGVGCTGACWIFSAISMRASKQKRTFSLVQFARFPKPRRSHSTLNSPVLRSWVTLGRNCWRFKKSPERIPKADRSNACSETALPVTGFQMPGERYARDT